MKVLILNKRSLVYGITVGILVIALIAAVANLIPNAVKAVAAKRELPIYSVERQDKYISLSFDAAWADAIIRTKCNH